MIQSDGVTAIVYSATLWSDNIALLAIMRQHVCDATNTKSGTELHAFCRISDVISELTTGCTFKGKVITTAEVMLKLEELGFGNMAYQDWLYLVQFRLSLTPLMVVMLEDCLVHVKEVRTKPTTYFDIHALHPTDFAWPKIFLLMETYLSELLCEDDGEHKAMSHKGPHAKMAKTPMTNIYEHF